MKAGTSLITKSSIPLTEPLRCCRTSVHQHPTSAPPSSTSFRHFASITSPSRPRVISPLLSHSASRHVRTVSKQIILNNRTSSKMSFSNADTGDKPADPYKEKNYQEVPLKEKVEGLVQFISNCKFGMMTTRIADTGLLTSRCMALAAKVSTSDTPLDI